MNRNNFFAFISSKDENDILTVKYEQKIKKPLPNNSSTKNYTLVLFAAARLV